MIGTLYCIFKDPLLQQYFEQYQWAENGDCERLFLRNLDEVVPRQEVSIEKERFAQEWVSSVRYFGHFKQSVVTST
jgi:hypothetical protein